jgi:hypothetical protein
VVPRPPANYPLSIEPLAREKTGGRMEPDSPPPDEGAEAIAAGPSRGRSGTVRRISVVVIAALVLVAAIVVAGTLLLRSPAGHVYFSADPYDQASGKCQFAAPMTTADAAQPFYMIAFFSDTLAAGDSYSLAITRDGAAVRDSGELTATAKFQCYVEAEALGPLDPGLYEFTFTHAGKVEAAGSITVR